MGKAVGIGLIAVVLLAFNIIAGQADYSSAPDVPQQADDCLSPYIVQRGDTLGEIAKMCNTTIPRLLYENPIITNKGIIYPGQKVYLPNVTNPVEEEADPDAEAAAPPIPVTGDQPTEAAEQVDAAERQVYRVLRGDTLAKIAGRFDTSVEMLLLANPAITNPNRIYVNQEILIPSREALSQLQEEAAQRQEAAQQEIVQSVEHNGERWIDVDLTNQKVRAYEGDQVVQTFTVSTGTWRTPTVTGQYDIWIKLRVDDMKGPGYDLRDVPYVMYFYKGYGLHGTYWHNNFGTPMSHGCVNLQTDDAAWLYEFASVGTLVNVH
jgi:lipoprotein-anchoring transpeptidase ErfK/SrfK